MYARGILKVLFLCGALSLFLPLSSPKSTYVGDLRLDNITWRRPRISPRKSVCESGSVPEAVKRYSQFGEDQYIFDYFWGVTNGTFLEVGAWNGIGMSNTNMLASSFGWAGILIEPRIDQFRELDHNRNESFVFNCALCSSPRIVHFGSVWQQSMLVSSQILDNALPFSEDIPCHRLQTIIDIAKYPHINFMSLDVVTIELGVFGNFHELFLRKVPSWTF